MVRLLSFLTLLLFVYGGILAQGISGPEQDCPNAIPVCQTFYTQPNTYSGTGQIQDLQGIQGSCLRNFENNSVWYIFTVTQSGVLEMTITPSSQDDYDFAIYNLTGLTCADIPSGLAPEVRCNYAADTAGGSPTGLQIGATATSAPVNGPQFLAPLNAVQGETYVLLVDNFNIGGGGYTLDFTTNSPNAASIIDNVRPFMVSMEPTSCDTTTLLELLLSEKVVCDSIDTLGTQFTITGPSNVTVVAAGGADCAAGSYTQRIFIRLSTPIIIGGSYTINVNAAADGRAITDFCGNAITNAPLVFNMPDIITADFDFTISPSCLKDTFYFEDRTTGTPVSWQWNFGDGSGGSNLQNPLHTFPDTITYNITLTANSADCSSSVTRAIDVGLSYRADFSFTPTDPCVGDTVFFTDLSPATANNHLWQFGDGNIAGVRDPFHVYDEPGNFTISLSIADSQTPGCSGYAELAINVRPLPFAEFFSDANPVCSGTPVRFADNSDGTTAAWFWDFGNGDTSNDSLAIYVFPSGGTYTVTHIIDDVFCGSDTATMVVEVLQRPIFSLGNDTAICLSETVILAGPSGVDTYQWSTGETSQIITFTDVPSEVSLTVTSEGCEFIDIIFINEKKEDCYYVKVPSAFSPNGDGKNDFLKIFLLRIESFNLKIFNRWGEMVYETVNANLPWDGTHKGELQDAGVFQYVIDGRSISGERFFRSGNVTLIR